MLSPQASEVAHREGEGFHPSATTCQRSSRRGTQLQLPRDPHCAEGQENVALHPRLGHHDCGNDGSHILPTYRDCKSRLHVSFSFCLRESEYPIHTPFTDLVSLP